MERRFDLRATPAYEAMLALERALSRLERPLVELVKVRASQLNGCAFCLEMHTRDARAAGVGDEKLDLVAAFREASVFSPRERAALAWTEAVTRIADTRAPYDVYAEARALFDEGELCELTWAIGAINLWNRVVVASRKRPAPRAADAG